MCQLVLMFACIGMVWNYFTSNFTFLFGHCWQLCGGKPSEGVFVGAFLSMSSTAVVKPTFDMNSLIGILYGVHHIMHNFLHF